MQPRFVAQPEVAASRLIQVLPDWQPQALGMRAIYASRQRMPPALRALLDYLADWFGQGATEF
jgi:DNA-binding transcriptional LysR family regulator